MRRNSPLSKAIAFTLVELIVTIAIVGVLAVLGLQVSKKALEKQRAIKCVGQLGGIYTTLRLYALDNNNCFPRSYFSTPSWANWFANSPLSQYGGGDDLWEKLVICPENRRAQVISATGRKGYPYTVNYNILRATAPTAGGEYPMINLASLATPSQMILMQDSQGTSAWGIGYNSRSSGWARTSDSHGPTGNVLWADGHVTSMSLQDITDDHLVPKKP
jgi:prepilin-type processing-associated H-X9-DG protein/prepilin-type N-terminal cleavage/methylation domain-containing protein